jgi:hypothetical protein
LEFKLQLAFGTSNQSKFMKNLRSIINSRSHMALHRPKRLVLVSSVAGGVLIGLTAVWLLGRIPASADTASDNRALDLAVQDTITQLLANESAPLYADKLDQVVGAGMAILHPDLVLAERRKDPAYVQAEAEAAYALLNPVAVGAERMKDPAFRQQCEAAAAFFQH